ncbi:hypothetical protein H9K76_08695 [Diaphorobacter ruginosibacter]|uniref:Uncharacterized protein n=1 Tax=Diaphorobacter ruginosibacter TaxID=1715720 RepID=A0A7G9RVA0_9BURK|nr:hypothetical protein H9K76_08695 [Diaphorobacter ruginosibacter]
MQQATNVPAPAAPASKADAKPDTKPDTKVSKPAKEDKAAAKAAGKSAKPAAAEKAKPVKAAAKEGKASKDLKEAKEAKAKKPKLVRDSFTIPKDEYAVIDDLKLRGAQLGHQAKKSELLRAGLKLLASLNDQQLLAALRAVPAIKTGRPSK